MTRRNWAVAVGVGLCSGMLPACTHTPARDAGAVNRSVPPPLFMDPPVVASLPGVSPFNPVPPPEVKPQSAPFEDGARPQRDDRASYLATTLGAPELAANDFPRALPHEPITRAKPPDDPPIVGALKALLDKQPEAALEKLRGLDKTNQELLLALLPLAVWLGEGSLSRASPREMGVLVDSLDRVLGPVRARAPLTIDQMCFCGSIHGFGDYSPLPPDHRFHRGDSVMIYVELRNFTTLPQPARDREARYLIHLVGSAQIWDDAGHPVLSQPIVFERQGPQVEISRNLRHDYYDAYSFRVPADIRPGPYTLQVEVEDRGSNPPRRVTRRLDFRVTNLPAAGT